jgi:glyoxylase-like metal-dependent hydrolase (beta-lactamase superfamily II)
MLVTENIYQLNGMPGMGVWGANVFLLVDKDLTLIDTGFKGRAAGIMAQIKKLGYSVSDVAHIIVTHHHIDHVGSLAELKRATGAKVVAHEADSPYINGTLPQPGPVKHNTLSKALTPLYKLWAHAPVAVDIIVDDEDELPVLGGIKVVHTPGHTPGSISLLLKKEKLAIVGDLMSRGKRIRKYVP